MLSTLRKNSLSLAAFIVLGVFSVTGILAPSAHAQARRSEQKNEASRPDTTTATPEETQPEAAAVAPTEAEPDTAAFAPDEAQPYTTTVTPAVQLQYASTVAAGNTITISRAPVTTSTGALIYEDVTLQLAVGASGQITVASGYPKVVTSPTLLVGGFQAGTYVGPLGIDSGKMGFTLIGPGIATGGTEWSILAAAGYDACTVPGNATFFVGPAHQQSHLFNTPQASRHHQHQHELRPIGAAVLYGERRDNVPGSLGYECHHWL